VGSGHEAALAADHLAHRDRQPRATASVASVEAVHPIGALDLTGRADQDQAAVRHGSAPRSFPLVGIEGGALAEHALSHPQIVRPPLPLTALPVLSILGYILSGDHLMPNETHTSSPVVEVSSVLRRAREGRGESLLQAAEGTRISATYLEALEDDAPVEAFPSALYARFFLRAYARYLGVEEGPLVEVFSRRHGLEITEAPAVDEPPAEVTEPAEPPIAPLIQLRSARRGARRLFSGARVPQRRAPVPVTPTRAPVVLSPARRVRPRRRIARIPRTLLVAAVGIPLLALGLRFQVFPFIGERDDPAPTPRPAASTPTLPELPRGGRLIFPDYRVVAFYGAARTEALGILGIGPDLALEKLLEQAEPYDRPGRPVLPAFHLLATVASGAPGTSGLYRERVDDLMITGYLEAAREARILLILDVQPGRADFMTEIRALEKYLREPDVGLAIDPEWHVGPGQVPGEHLGSTDAATINTISAYLARIVRRHDLPEKLFVVHQFTEDMIRNKRDVKTRPGLAMAFDVDGFGDQPNKISKYDAFTRGYGKKFHHGIKLYYDQDTNLMSPRAVLRLEPEPDLIIYQ
jgi:transcriptional regulator with XRE-family HTH domain